MILWKGIYNSVSKHSGNLYRTMEQFGLWFGLYSSNTLRTCLRCGLRGDAEIPHLSWGSWRLPSAVWPFPGPTFWKQVSTHREQCRESLGCQKCWLSPCLKSQASFLFWRGRPQSEASLVMFIISEQLGVSDTSTYF